MGGLHYDDRFQGSVELVVYLLLSFFLSLGVQYSGSKYRSSSLSVLGTDG